MTAAVSSSGPPDASTCDQEQPPPRIPTLHTPDAVAQQSQSTEWPRPRDAFERAILDAMCDEINPAPMPVDVLGRAWCKARHTQTSLLKLHKPSGPSDALDIDASDQEHVPTLERAVLHARSGDDGDYLYQQWWPAHILAVHESDEHGYTVTVGADPTGMALVSDDDTTVLPISSSRLQPAGSKTAPRAFPLAGAKVDVLCSKCSAWFPVWHEATIESVVTTQGGRSTHTVDLSCDCPHAALKGVNYNCAALSAHLSHSGTSPASQKACPRNKLQVLTQQAMAAGQHVVNAARCWAGGDTQANRRVVVDNCELESDDGCDDGKGAEIVCARHRCVFTHGGCWFTQVATTTRVKPTTFAHMGRQHTMAWKAETS